MAKGKVNNSDCVISQALHKLIVCRLKHHDHPLVGKTGLNHHLMDHKSKKPTNACVV